MTDRFGYAVQYFTVIYLECYSNAEPLENFGDDLDQIDLAEQAAAADHVDVALIELAVSPFLRPVGPPNGLDLVTLEREGYFSLMLYDIAGQRDGQVIPQPLFAQPCREGVRVAVQLLVAHSAQKVARVQYLEQQLVALVAVFA